MAEKKKIKSDKVDSPHPYLIQEVEDLEKAKDENTKLQEELKDLKNDYETLKSQLNSKLTDTDRLQLAVEIQENQNIKGLSDRVQVLEFQLNQLDKIRMRLEAENLLLKQQKLETRDKFELDEEWKIKNARNQELKRQILGLESKHEIIRVAMDEDIKDLDQIRIQYNQMVDNFQTTRKFIRSSIQDYNDLRKKTTNSLPPIYTPGQVIDTPHKGNAIRRFFRRLLGKK